MVNLSSHLGVSALASWLRARFRGAPEGIIFDCDGVLLDSCPANVRYYNLLREGVGLPPMTQEQERYVHMSTAQQAVEAVIPVALRSALRDVIPAINYGRDIQPLMAPHEGLHAFLDSCASEGLRLAVHTNRRDGMPALLHRFGLTDYFDPVITVLVAPPKPDPGGTRMILDQWRLAPERLLFVGDSSTDRDAAAGAGVPFLAFRAPDLSDGESCASFSDFQKALELLRA